MDKINELAEAIQHYISGEVTEKERQDVEAWLSENVNHQQMMDEFRDPGYVSRKYSEYMIFDKEIALERFLSDKRKIDRRKVVRRVVAVAAMIALIVGVFVIFRLSRNVDDNKYYAISPVVSPGGSKATLFLETGVEIVLQDSVNMNISANMIMIKIEGGKVSYTESELNGVSVKEPVINTIITPRNGEYNLTLSDGTRVWLNAESKVQYPVKFIGERREVYVEGEVYFEVEKDSLHPFWVKTKNSLTQVLGTSFNVRAYPDEINRTTLIEGHVQIKCLEMNMKLNPNEQWVWNERGGFVTVVDPKVILGWKNGHFAFQEQKLSDVFRELERWYNINVYVVNEKINDLNFTGIFPRYEKLDKVLEIIELTTCVRCKVNGMDVMVSDE